MLCEVSVAAGPARPEPGILSVLESPCGVWLEERHGLCLRDCSEAGQRATALSPHREVQHLVDCRLPHQREHGSKRDCQAHDLGRSPHLSVPHRSDPGPTRVAGCKLSAFLTSGFYYCQPLLYFLHSPHKRI